MLGHFKTYDNLAFRSDGGRLSLSSLRRSANKRLQDHHEIPDAEQQQQQSETDFDEIDLDDDSFRSDLEREEKDRDSEEQRGEEQFCCEKHYNRETEDVFDPEVLPKFSQSMSHRQRHEHLLREGNRRASLQLQLQQMLPNVKEDLIMSAEPESSAVDNSMMSMEMQTKRAAAANRPRSSVRLKREAMMNRPPEPPPDVPRTNPRSRRRRSGGTYQRPVRPEAKLSNLFGIIDTSKLRRRLFGDEFVNIEEEQQRVQRGQQQQQQQQRLEPRQPMAFPSLVLQQAENLNLTPTELKKQILKRERQTRGVDDALFYGSLCSFAAGVLLVIAFASPYWLVSWEDTQSPFKNMGLWEFCFYKFHHPDYQFDHLFHGCHALYGHEYRLIREKLLPGWLMVVQLFATLSIIFSFSGQIMQVCLLLRAPLEVILRFEHHFCAFSLVCNALTAASMFLAVLIFGCCCWDRDWLYYPNFNYPSWSYAFANFVVLISIFAACFMYKDYKDAKARKEKNKALIMQMHPPAFSTAGSHYHMGGSGYI